MRSAARPVVLSIDLGATKLAAALFSADGTLLHRISTQLGARRGAQVGALVCGHVRKLQRAADRRGCRVAAAGICVPGIAQEKTGRVWAPNIGGWQDYPLRDEVSAALGPRVVPVIVDNDRTACILGEVWQGAARGCRDAVFIAVGTGIGAGLLVNGEVVRGAHGIAGSIGWLALSSPFLPAYADCGDFEYHASGAGLARVASRLIAQTPGYRGRLRRKREVTAREVFTAYEAGDSVATQVLGDAIGYWGRATANLVSLLDPQRIIFGGGVFGPATRFLRDIHAEARRWAQPISIRRVKLVPSQLGGDAGLYGAGCLALRSLRRSP